MPDDRHDPFAHDGPDDRAPAPSDALAEALLCLAADQPEPRPGQVLARGVCRHLLSHGFVTVEELTPVQGLRVDVMALGPKGEVWVIECKSSRADYTSDRKWQGYLEWCDRFFWAVDEAFPSELLPAETGLIVADGYDAEILRLGPETKLAGARRKTVTQKFARHAALRAQALRDPGARLGW
ncbi:MmcB family DNA repair protein [Wenxinia saemankumensis]|uniref:DNA repair protein MmcB-related protein n=1 Tax=Wenxinia saemankumensis TaxID=1447782 RepID=A0A1M6ALI5_9RHOB|nr:MmcB family DNA repair protein [Wenxinia saemankumensis]SHI37277.1 hypothetical protein SAMN05444417_0497 [Wenxinia saemankumensis]